METESDRKYVEKTGSTSKTFTIVFLIIWILSQGFFGFSAVNELGSRNTFGFGTYFWIYLGVSSGLWILMLISYLVWAGKMATDVRTRVRVSYPRFTWESNWFFFTTAVLWLATWIPYAVVLGNLGVSFAPDYSLGPVNQDNLQVYALNFFTAFFSLIAFFLGINFLFIYCPTDVFKLVKTDALSEKTPDPNTPVVWMNKGQRAPTYTHPGALQYTRN